MTGKQTAPDANGHRQSLPLPDRILGSELDPPGYRIGRAAVQWNRRGPHGRRISTRRYRAAPGGKFCRGRSVFDREPRGSNEDFLPRTTILPMMVGRTIVIGRQSKG